MLSSRNSYSLTFLLKAVSFSLLTGCASVGDSPIAGPTVITDAQAPVQAPVQTRQATPAEPRATSEAETLAGLQSSQQVASDITKTSESNTHSNIILEAEPATETDLWKRLRAGFQLSHEVDRKRVFNELKWYVNHPEYVERVANRAAPHLYYIIEELEKRGLPLEFALLPIVESAYDPFAYSHGRAAGLWQFIPATGRLYGLKIDWWYDGRRDVRASTLAAIEYLDMLHGMFDGDWLLALASYNAGQGNVRSSIRKSKLSKEDLDFWSLNVFRETYTYVPRLLAISELIANPERYHMTLPAIKNVPQWEVVDTHSQIDLHKAAQLAGITTEKMYSLNAGFNQWATHPEGKHELIVPVDNADAFRQGLESLPVEQRLAWKRHKVRNGENLGSIAQQYRTTVETIRRANNVKNNIIRAGDSLLIPTAEGGGDYGMSASGRLASKQDNLTTKHGEAIVHVVQPGDSFWDISRAYGVGMRQLAKWNGMGTTGLLHPGTELKVYNQKKTSNKSSPVTSRPTSNQQVRKLNYKVRQGESLSLIANKFNVTVQAIKSWNQSLNLKRYIHPGDRLTLYIDVTRLIN
jgi:membrane-bound lytic murein transglycosylase D